MCICSSNPSSQVLHPLLRDTSAAAADRYLQLDDVPDTLRSDDAKV